MPSENNTPAIRFAGFTDGWEKREVSEIASFSKGAGYSKADICDSGIPLILYGRLYTKYETIIREVETFAVPKEGGVYSRGGEVIVPASGETAEDISIASVVENEGVLLGGDLNVITPQSRIDSAFLALSISYGEAHKSLSKLAQGKSVVHLHNSDIRTIGIHFPEKGEQERIAAVFEKLDTLITLHRRKCELLETLKKSMLEKLFPKEGELIPELRFAGFTGEWERRKLGDCFTERQERSEIGELISVTIQDGIKKFEELGRHDTSSEDKSHYKCVEVGDIAYNSMRMWQGACGFSPYRGILSPAYTVIIPQNGISSKFFSYSFKRPDVIHVFQLCSQGITSDTWNLKFPAFSEIEAIVPEWHEQQKIAIFFESLDTLLTLHRRKLELLQNIKKACLEKMFV